MVKKIEAIYFGNIRALSEHPAITPNAAKPFIRKRERYFSYFQDIISGSKYLYKNLKYVCF